MDVWSEMKKAATEAASKHYLDGTGLLNYLTNVAPSSLDSMAYPILGKRKIPCLPVAAPKYVKMACLA